MDYDDDNVIEGFNDGVERALGSNPLFPNTWEAFWYGYNHHEGEDSYVGMGCIDIEEVPFWIILHSPDLAYTQCLTSSPMTLTI